MQLQSEPLTDNNKRLQRCINDLISVLALPAIWTGYEPREIASTVLDTMLGMLSLDFIYIRFDDPSSKATSEMARFGPAWRRSPELHEISAIAGQLLQEDRDCRAPESRKQFGDSEIAVILLKLGLQAEFGVIVAGCRRDAFPDHTEKLVLTVAANQTSIALKEAQLLTEQKRVSKELDERVALRTAELAKANEELKKEIAERKTIEGRLENARSELTRAARTTSLGVLTASIAHEVSQPLSGIVTNANTCLRMLAADPANVDGARETARRTIRDANRASDVITRLRALFSSKEIAAGPVDLNDAAREVLALLSSEIQGSAVSLRTDLPDDLPCVAGDRIQLQQIIVNLVRNACDSMKAVGDDRRQLLVRSRMDRSNGVCLEVQDTGSGFDAEAAERMFEPFYTTKNDGMGIGLSVSRSIIERHQGRIWATPNCDGPGATFSFSVPRGL